MVQTPKSPPTSVSTETTFILKFEQVGIQDVPSVGGKNASLGEMIQQLSPQGVRVPTGFATTAAAYNSFIRSGGLVQKMRSHLDSLDTENIQALRAAGQAVRDLILETPFPKDLETAIAKAYLELCEQTQNSTLDVAVRSSATAEDLPDASFAGQQETYLNVHGVKGVLAACHKCFASLFTDRAISYRTLQGFDHFSIALSVGVQQMVRSDLATAGVMFSIDTETGFEHAALIAAAYGLGENVVQGTVTPDEYLVFKPTLQQGYRPILKKQLGSKAVKMVYDSGGNKLTKNVAVEAGDRNQFALTDDEILTLARWACIIEDHYSTVRGLPTPMDMEWAKDGLIGELFIVQARPETVQSQKSSSVLRRYRLQSEDNAAAEALSSPLITGQAVGEMIGQGAARVIQSAANIADFQPGEVLVTPRTDPDWEPIMKRASAIVTDQGGRTCHAAIIAREMGIPAIVGCGDATRRIEPGVPVTVTCAEGEVGKVYDGLIPFKVEEAAIDNLPSTRTQIMMNVGNPEEAFRLAAIPCDGVGLARLEFIIANHIKVHPLALLQFDQLTSEQDKRAIAQLTALYERKSDYFVERLTHGIATIAAAFYPKPVVIRLSDFKSNEYANLLGGKDFEPIEENPMLGWRGASRYTDPRYRDAFALECLALKQVRGQMGLTNVIPMVPFCRTPEEGQAVLNEMASHGLVRGQDGLQVYVMCEIPNNVILVEEFAEVFDGFSIGSNDLTQLTLGLDRDSALVAHLFDERSAGVKKIVSMAIDGVRRSHRKIGLCGQAPSDYPEFAQFLVEEGIDSISLNPDSVIKTTLAIAAIEQGTSTFTQPFYL
ncbi:phosphoenolpyruvate synthase [Synechococcus sp. PCC 7335]|uniref:phosphoenolpyruvate synthase n=1 Tax=Synechococcus sp. (strain ATCC 29403 / PCC 7335) TaxID=91464 RepID=UPI00017ED2B6|nr:phosphoenolpyruvate synthase [Synechococcus sp. PCC 7335]EDX83207.1 phosphoenolpyruvate synthase [Synechococcus sp. PCC 7335]